MISATTTDAHVDLQSGTVHAAIICNGIWQTVCGIKICNNSLTEEQKDACGAGEKEHRELQQINFNQQRSALTCAACRREINKLLER